MSANPAVVDLTVVGILLYIVAQLAVGLLVSRGIRTETEYLVAGRRLGYGFATLSIFATWYGAETCIGAAGAAYEDGLAGGTADPFGYTFCLLLMGLVFAAALWRRGLTTLGDLFRQRFSPGVERLVVLIMVPPSILWGGAQMRAFGQVLAASAGWNLEASITIAAAVVVLYTAFGGLLADVTTDAVQGVLLTLGLAVLLVVVVSSLGGPGAAMEAVDATRLGALRPAGRPTLAVVEAWLVPILGSVTAQELVARVIAARSPRVARRSTLAASAIYLIVGLVPLTLGLLGPRLVPNLVDPERILLVLARAHLDGVLYVMFAGALVSAILSTADSNLLSAAALVSHNLILPLLPGAGERTRLALSRAAVVGAGFLSWSLAFSEEGVYALVEEASAFGGAGMFVLMTFALFSRFGGVRTAVATLVTGTIVQLSGTYLGMVPYPFTLSLAASLAAYVAVGAWEGRPAVIPAPDAGGRPPTLPVRPPE